MPPTSGGGQPLRTAAQDVSLAYWASLFFTVLAAVAFRAMARQGPQRLRAFHNANLLLQVLRAATMGLLYAALWLDTPMGTVATLSLLPAVLTVISLVAAIRAKPSYERGAAPPVPLGGLVLRYTSG